MNFQKVQRKNRKAISPVLATVILIAITLIAAIAIAGFVFGLFSGFTSSAQVSAVLPTIAHATILGGVTFQNTGTANVNANSMTLTYGGNTCTPVTTSTLLTAGGGAINVPITAIGTCSAAGVSAGEAFTGSLALSNGGQVPFSGTFT